MGIKANEGGVGNIYYVCQSSNTIPYAHVVDHHQETYIDGSTAVQGTISTALTATVAERNDYVIVNPDTSDYDEGRTLTMNKANVHLLCPAGLGAKFGCATRAASVDPATGAHAITITGQGVEVAGLWIRGYTEKYCVTSNAKGVWIHHNDCGVTATSSVAGGIYVGSAGAGTHIERNYVYNLAGGGTWVFGIRVSESATRAIINNNVVMAGNASELTYGIDTIPTGQSSQFVIIDSNRISESPAVSGIGASTITVGIRSALAALTTNNLVGIADISEALQGGTTSQTYVENYTSSNGGKLLDVA